MKKILSLLASLGLVATSAITVVACGTEDKTGNANYNLAEIKTWFSNAQPDPIKKEEGKTMLLAIGGRHNSDTLSYLATLNNLVFNKGINTDANDLIKQENIRAMEEILNNFSTTTKDETRGRDWEQGLTRMIQALNLRTDAPNDPERASVIAEDYFYYNFEDPLRVSTMSFKTVLVDELEDFWSTKLGKGIINEIIAVQLKEIMDFAGNNEKYAPSNDLRDLVTDQKKYDAFIRRKTRELNDWFQKGHKNEGPWFIVIRSGKIVGITQGFRNYWDFNPQYTESEKQTNQLSPELILKTWNEFSDSISKTLAQGTIWLKDNFITTSENLEATKFAKKNGANITSNSTVWNTKTSGESNVPDLDKPRGDDDKEEEENASMSYQYHQVNFNNLLD